MTHWEDYPKKLLALTRKALLAIPKEWSWIFHTWLIYLVFVIVLAHIFSITFEENIFRDPAARKHYHFLLHGFFPDNYPFSPLARWDSVWFMSIAQYGYGHVSSFWSGLNNAAFFPLYPLLIKLFSGLFYVELSTAGHIISSGCLLISMFLLFYEFRPSRVSAVDALTPLLGLLAFPTSFIFVSVYSESLFLVLSLAAYILTKKGHILGGSVAAFLAGLTRPQALALAALLAVWAIVKRRKGEKNLLLFLPAISAALGVLLFFLYLKFKFGDFFLFIHSKHAFGSFKWPKNIWQSLAFPFYSNWLIHSRDLFGHIMEDIGFLISISGCIYFFKKKKFPEAWFIFSYLMLNITTGTFWGFGRHILTLFPLVGLFRHLSKIWWLWYPYLVSGIFLQGFCLFRYVILSGVSP